MILIPWIYIPSQNAMAISTKAGTRHIKSTMISSELKRLNEKAISIVFTFFKSNAVLAGFKDKILAYIYY